MSPASFKLRLFLLIGIVSLVLRISSVSAQVLEPRSYSNVPVGLNFLVAAYGYNTGGVLFDPSIPLEDAHINIHVSALGYAHTIKLGSLLGKFDMIAPYGWLSGTAVFQGEPVSRVVSGLGDPSVRMSVNFIGAPALTLFEFKDYKQNFILGGSLQFFVPLGQYDPDRVVNLGTNRFTIKPELGISKTIGPLFLDLAAAVAFYTTNHDFYQGKTRSQEPIKSMQGHIIYSFRKGIWTALDGTYYWGGASTLDGLKGNDLQKNARLGITFVMPVNIHHSLKLNYSTGVSTRTGSDFDSFSIGWQYKWGGGIPK